MTVHVRYRLFMIRMVYFFPLSKISFIYVQTLFMMSYESESHSQLCVLMIHIDFFSGALRRMIDTAEKAVGVLARRDPIGADNNGSMDGSATLATVQEPEKEIFRSYTNSGHDGKIHFNFEDQRYRRPGPHMHPQGLASEPDLHKQTSSSI